MLFEAVKIFDFLGFGGLILDSESRIFGFGFWSFDFGIWILDFAV